LRRRYDLVSAIAMTEAGNARVEEECSEENKHCMVVHSSVSNLSDSRCDEGTLRDAIVNSIGDLSSRQPRGEGA